MGGYQGIELDLRTTVAEGVKANEIDVRKSHFGVNYIAPPPLTPFWKFCWEALQDPTLQFLCFSASVSLAVGFGIEEERRCYGYSDGIAILVAVAVVVLVGAAQESAKEKQFRDLTDSASDELVNVIRDGTQVRVSNREVVVGDCVVLSTGDIICADGLVFERNTLKIFEGALTGESNAISKGQYEFKEKGTFEVVKSLLLVSVLPDVNVQIPKDDDLTKFFPANTSLSIEQMRDKYEPTPSKTPLVFKGTQVQDGEGKMIVIAVGKNTYEQLLLGDRDDGDDEEESDRSIMQRKLDDMTILITKVGAMFGLGILFVLLLRFAISFGQKDCCYEAWDHSRHWMQLIKFIIISITIFVVAVPEGLPLAVTIALAFSVKKMMTDKNMVKHNSAVETMGSATTICSDKTGTLTTSMMTVMKCWAADSSSDPSSMRSAKEKLKELMCAAMTINTSEKTDIVAKIQKKKDKSGAEVQEIVKLDGRVVEAYSGNATECAMLKFVNLLHDFRGDPGSDSMPYKSYRKSFPESMPGRSSITFSSKRKRMSTFVPMPAGSPAPFRLYCKGASEMVVKLCSTYCNEEGQAISLNPEVSKRIEEAIDNFADSGLRTIAVAYKDCAESLVQSDGVLPESAESELTLICIVGIEDPLREEVPGAIQTCRQAGIVVRMVTGDNLSTAKAISRKANILTEAGEREGREIALTGEQFRQMVLTQQNAEHPERCINQAEFDKIWPKLRVLARSTPTDKLVLVTGIQNSRITVDAGIGVKQSRQVVAVTGDGTNDAPALKQADVGFAMFINGTQVAQQAADIVILDDNFQSIVAAVKWGRCVYDNICKFLQFQLTVNIVACVLATVGAATLTESPITVIQLLWVNLIMDSFASLALSTEDPNRSPGLKEQLLSRNPYPRTDPILSKIMVKNMFAHALTQLAILFWLIFGIGDICMEGADVNTCAEGPVFKKLSKIDLRSGRPPEFDNQWADLHNCVPYFQLSNPMSFYNVSNGISLDASNEFNFTGYAHLRSNSYCMDAHGCGSKSQHMTMIFNEFNSRKIHNEFNVFKGVLQSPMFMAVIIGTLGVQVILIQVNPINMGFGCTALNGWQWGLCAGLGFISIPINFLFHYIPCEWIPLGSWAGGLNSEDIDEELEKEKKELGQPLSTVSN
ncbi:hypothetical protein GUITHDRAFT_114157 [Guillardia theta CCMP2712]|uniref:Calcium-transporting ATPase n=1 Tax=Guillardia theta (strain CCMP2712) TaxID=905079 RepID=L1IUZ7_GUITC|nr:hypothetical protein GUITHDRAFT_114157 [Guillardia theta CCMP2712]EKX39660.1 hypothetical protein GUITHDRAFT_114157 [Guillardia theta CCMP2712]|eukprot:XP_005826640.1 hypothetical protein GUITHDRAFT_114157 [Guillardia theta CCMP2712]